MNQDARAAIAEGATHYLLTRLSRALRRPRQELVNAGLHDGVRDLLRSLMHLPPGPQTPLVLDAEVLPLTPTSPSSTTPSEPPTENTTTSP